MDTTEKPNLNYITQLSGENKLFKKQVLTILKKELPQEIRAYELCLVEGDFLECAEEVHKLKHKISILGLEKGYKVAVDYENQLKEGEKDLKVAFEEILAEMMRFIKNI